VVTFYQQLAGIGARKKRILLKNKFFFFNLSFTFKYFFLSLQSLMEHFTLLLFWSKNFASHSLTTLIILKFLILLF